MEQLPENDEPQTPSEQHPTDAEAPTPAVEDKAVPPTPEPMAEPAAEAGAGIPKENEAPSPEATPPAEQPALLSQPDRPVELMTSQGRNAEAESQEPVAAETEETPSGESTTSASTPGEAEAPREEVAAEVEKHEVRKPHQAPARPEKPTGPRLADLRPGTVVEGTVTRIEKYGAFVNLGLVERRDGLIHISELAPNRIRRVEDVVQVGSAVRARVVSVDMGRGRIALSLNDVDEGMASEASAGPSEPALTAMAMAFQQAQSRREDQERSEARGGEVGSRKKREQEELMRKFRN